MRKEECQDVLEMRLHVPGLVYTSSNDTQNTFVASHADARAPKHRDQDARTKEMMLLNGLSLVLLTPNIPHATLSFSPEEAPPRKM